MPQQKRTNNMVVNTSVPSNVFNEIEARALADHTTRATIVRQLLCRWHVALKDDERLAP
jgi:hypothetical protein